MADLSLESPAAFRLVAAAAAMVGSLALVALGVQIGTDGFAGLGADRNPASERAAQAAAVVALPRTRPALQDLDATLLSLVPLSGLVVPSFSTGVAPGSSTTADGGATGSTDPTVAPPGGPSGEAPTEPTSPLPVPVPVPTAPDPSPVLDPLAPVTDPLIATLDPILGGDDSSSAGTDGDAAEPTSDAGGLLDTVAGLLGL